MSASILGKPRADPESDHVSIIRKLRFNETLHGGWEEWSVACICGGLYETTRGGWYIPSKGQAERIFNRHAGLETGTSEDEEVTTDSAAGEGVPYYCEDRTVYV